MFSLPNDPKTDNSTSYYDLDESQFTFFDKALKLRPRFVDLAYKTMRYTWLNDNCVNLEGPVLRLEEADQQNIVSLRLDSDELFLLLDPVHVHIPGGE